MRRWFSVLVLVLMAGLAAPAVQGQDGVSRKKQEKIQAKKAKQEKKEKAKKERYDRRRHMSVQDKAARKRLKRHSKRADKRGSGVHRDGFFRRTFGW